MDKMDLKISVNFDFGKLANNIGDIMDEYTRGYAKESERASKDNIEGSFSPIAYSNEINKIQEKTATKTAFKSKWKAI